MVPTTSQGCQVSFYRLVLFCWLSRKVSLTFFNPTQANSFFRILISCIKFLAKCMCPQCLSLKSKITKVGSETDMCNWVTLEHVDNEAWCYDIEMVREMLFEKGVNISSSKIDQILGPTSAVPTRICLLFYHTRLNHLMYLKNTFSEFANCLGKFKFNFYQLLIPDLLHEFELSVWKAVFTHLIHILYAFGNDTIHYLNSRFFPFLFIICNSF